LSDDYVGLFSIITNEGQKEMAIIGKA